MRKIAFVCLLAIFQSLLCADDKPAFYAVLVVDSDDRNIGAAAQADLLRYQNALTFIIEQINYEPKITVIQSPLEKEEIEKTLKAIQAGPEDIVFFMYSGHGGYDLDGYPWPVLALRCEPKWGISGKAVVDLLRSGKQCLTYILFDACNKSPSYFEYDSKIKKPEPMFFKGGYYPGVKELFLNHSGYVIATSSKRYEYSYTRSSKPDGSYFLTEVISYLIDYSLEKKPDWYDILEDASTHCYRRTRFLHRKYGKDFTYQHPYYEIKIHPNRAHKSKTKGS